MRCRGQKKEYSCSQGKTGAADIMKIRIQLIFKQGYIYILVYYFLNPSGFRVIIKFFPCYNSYYYLKKKEIIYYYYNSYKLLRKILALM